MGFTNTPSFLLLSRSMNSATITACIVESVHVRISELVFSFYHSPWNWCVACDTSRTRTAPQAIFRIPRDATILGSCRTLDELAEAYSYAMPSLVSWSSASGICYSLHTACGATRDIETLWVPEFRGNDGLGGLRAYRSKRGWSPVAFIHTSVLQRTDPLESDYRHGG